MNLEDEMEPKYASSRGRFWACILSAAACAGLGAWRVGETALNFFKPTAQEISSGVVAYTTTDNTSYLRAKRRVEIENAALHYGILGASLGLSLGLAGGILRRSVNGAAVSGIIGASVCGAAAAVASLALVPLFFKYYHQDQPNLLLPVLVRGGIFVVIGSLAGLSLSLGLGSKGNAAPMVGVALAGAIGALCGAVANEVVYAIAFPLARSESPVSSEPASRLLAHSLVAISIALAIAWNIRRKGSVSRPAVR